MKSKSLVWLLGIFLLRTGLSAEAQQSAKVPRIGLLYSVSASSGAPRIEAFRQGLRELGYVEGKTFLIEDRYAGSNEDRVPALAAELVRLKVDVIVTSNSGPTQAAKAATATIPIVMARDIDPIGNGFVASLARPAGNITGLSSLAPEISGKQVELLREIVPRISRLAVLGTSTSPGNAQSLKEIEITAAAFRVAPQYLNVLTAKDIEPAFRAAGKERADAILVLGSGVYASHRKQVVDLTLKNRLPAIFRSREYMKMEGSCPTE